MYHTYCTRAGSLYNGFTSVPIWRLVLRVHIAYIKEYKHNSHCACIAQMHYVMEEMLLLTVGLLVGGCPFAIEDSISATVYFESCWSVSRCGTPSSLMVSGVLYIIVQVPLAVLRGMVFPIGTLVGSVDYNSVGIPMRLLADGVTQCQW